MNYHSFAPSPPSASEVLRYDWSTADPTKVSSSPHTPMYVYRNPPVGEPILESIRDTNIIHPSLPPKSYIHERGMYWATMSQYILEKQHKKGIRKLEIGKFYVFLEEETQIGHPGTLSETNSTEKQGIMVTRYGNVYQGNQWVVRNVAFPLGHPDANQPPYEKIDVSNESLS